MAQRMYRELPDEVKQKISQSLKDYHAHKSETQKQHTNNRIAYSLRQYWASIPQKSASDGTNHTTMAQLIGADR